MEAANLALLVALSAGVAANWSTIKSMFGSWVIIGSQLNGDPNYLGPAITFSLVDFILPLALAVEIGHRARRMHSNPSKVAGQPSTTG